MWTLKRVVSAWAFKTALMLTRTHEAARFVPRDHFSYLFRQGEPPPTVQISVGCYRPEPGEAHHSMTAGAGEGHPSIKGSYRVVFSVGMLVFEVHGNPGVEGDIRVELASVLASGLWVPMTNSFPKIWPRTEVNVAWPPPQGMALNSVSLLNLTDRPVVV